MRPGARLWSIFAGPLVNIILVPITASACTSSSGRTPTQLRRDARRGPIPLSLYMINTGLLIFNLLPIYPLDGGQILQSILWFFIGFVRSLKVVSIIGLIGAGGLVLLAFSGLGSTLTFILAFFIGSQAFNGYSGPRRWRMSRPVPHAPPAQYPGQQYGEPPAPGRSPADPAGRSRSAVQPWRSARPTGSVDTRSSLLFPPAKARLPLT